MYTLSKVKELERKSTAHLKTMQNMVNFLARKIDELHDDSTYSEDFKREQVETERQNALPGIEEIFKVVKEVAAELKMQQAFWQSVPLVLSQMSFVGDDPVQDATTRLAWGQELAALPEGLVNLHFKSAVQDRNWPVVYQCYVAAQRKDIVLESLQDVELPDQLKALLAIETAHLNVAEGEFLMRHAHGTQLVPEQRLRDINERDNIELRVKNIKNRIAMFQAETEKAA
jgi:hypothetical protein